MKRKHKIGILASSLGLALVFVAWLVLAPRELGGSTSYVMVSGSSMEPKLERGDLAIVRERSEYEVGDVVVYSSRDLGTHVLHRIVARKGDRYVFKGDNNDFVDSTNPAKADLVGKLVLNVPAAGAAVAWVREPAHAAAIVAMLAGLVVLGGGVGVSARRRRRRRSDAAPAARLARWRALAALSDEKRTASIVVLAVFSTVLIGAGAFLFARPDSRTVRTDGAYRQSGTFSYSASAPDGPVYDGRTVRTGEPVFVRLIDSVSVRFDYRLESDARAAVGGTGRLLVRVSDGDGWKRTLPLGDDVSFAGPSLTLAGSVDLRGARRLIDRFEQLTGAHNESYMVTVVPEIAVRGAVAGQVLEDRFWPRLVFRLDQTRLALEPEGESVENGLVRSKPGVGTRSEPITISLLGLEARLSSLRGLTLAGGLLALVACFLFALLARRTGRPDEPALIEARYGAALLPVAGLHPVSPEHAVEMATMESLVRLAESYERLVLHEEADGVHTYFVEEDGVSYWYQAYDASEEPSREEMLGATLPTPRDIFNMLERARIEFDPAPAEGGDEPPSGEDRPPDRANDPLPVSIVEPETERE